MLATDYVSRAARLWPQKTAFEDERRGICYADFQKETLHIAAAIHERGFRRAPVAVFLDKSVECIVSFLGAACSGNFYSPLDTQMPVQRIQKIMDTLCPKVVVTDRAHREQAAEFAGSAELVVYEDAQECEVDTTSLQRTLEGLVIDTDILYVLFTSGSTGIPKGVMSSHRALVDFIEWCTECYGIDDSIIVGNQAPLYFSVSVFDVYQTLRSGGTMYIIPHTAFSFPVLLMQYMYDHHINTVNWVPSALSMVSTLGALDSPHLPDLKRVQFGGEVMPMKQLNRWRAAYPEVLFVNMYGPTEVTDTCTYYMVDRPFDNAEPLPIGRACKNMDVFLLDEKDRLIPEGEADRIGEICVRGTGLAYGYYNDPERTRETFVQNPLQNTYAETIYRTGDLARYNERGELVYVSRKDFQIKHMGHRIELGEIEAAAAAVDGVENAACIYDERRFQILLFYIGAAKETAVLRELKVSLPSYMLPGKVLRLEAMTTNPNGKVDRPKLCELYVK